MGASAQSGIEPRIFRIFISYASEDLPIAAAIGTCLKIALGDFFAEVNLDKWTPAAWPGRSHRDRTQSEASEDRRLHHRVYGRREAEPWLHRLGSGLFRSRYGNYHGPSEDRSLLGYSASDISGRGKEFPLGLRTVTGWRR